VIEVALAEEADVEEIGEVFRTCYGEDYAYPAFYDPQALKKMVFTDETIILVAREAPHGPILGTASVILHIGAYADLVGEFGRLAVRPEARGAGIGKLLMEERIKRVEKQLHLGLVENRVKHAFSQKISARHGFVPVGFLPLKTLFRERESVALYARHFGPALSLRKNNPRIIPEAYRVASIALENVEIGDDCIIDDATAPYPHGEGYECRELTTEGYATLLHVQRGRIHDREVFGPMRLHYGLFKLKARHSNYLLACNDGQIAAGIGFTIDEFEKAVKVFEIVVVDDGAVRFLLTELERRCRDDWDIAYVEVDVSAHAPRMQRTLLELQYVPVAYIPAMVFHEVERLDAMRFCRLLVPAELGEIELFELSRPICEAVIQNLTEREVLPQIAAAVPTISIFSGLNDEQARYLAAHCRLENFETGSALFTPESEVTGTYLILEGTVDVVPAASNASVGSVHAGETLGEISVLTASTHSATATAKTPVTAAVLSADDLTTLVRRRPDIGVILYRNLASGLGEKLRRTGQRIQE
jgi:GNAT superfamily N-acetyltransferase